MSRKRSAIVLDFNRYIGDPIIDYSRFGTIYHGLEPSEIEADKTTKGTIRRVKVTEEENYLRFSVDFSIAAEGEESAITDYTVIRCKIDNKDLRKFILFYSNRNWKSMGTGNLLSKILNGKIPLFSRNKSENLAIIKRIVGKYAQALELSNSLDFQIETTDLSLDQKIYDLYGIDNDERDFIDSEMSSSLSKNEEEDQTPENE